MQISDIRIRLSTKEGKLKAVASIIIDDCFAVHDIKIIESSDNRIFVAMPSRKTSDGEFKDVAHPINSETRTMLSDLILKKYNQVLSESQAEAKL